MPRHHLRVSFFVSFLDKQKRKITIKYATINRDFSPHQSAQRKMKKLSKVEIRNDGPPFPSPIATEPKADRHFDRAFVNTICDQYLPATEKSHVKNTALNRDFSPHQSAQRKMKKLSKVEIRNDGPPFPSLIATEPKADRHFDRAFVNKFSDNDLPRRRNLIYEILHWLPTQESALYILRYPQVTPRLPLSIPQDGHKLDISPRKSGSNSPRPLHKFAHQLSTEPKD